jgi:AraC-like DNA-binding protein
MAAGGISDKYSGLIAVCLVALTAYGFLPRRNATTNDAPDIGPKYQKSSLDKSEQQMILARLETLRATQHIHRQANLTLARLATAVRTTPHNLSQVLNTSAGGFHAWVAEARIEDARALLLAGPEFAVLEVAFQVGFNSKSAFYDAFKRATGQTPVAWLKDRREESELPLRDAT